MLPEETYNSPAAPRSVRMIERNYKDSGVSSRALMVFGIGDGGGGPGEEHLERLARLKNLEGLSPVKQETVADFLEKWQVDAARFATWVGELYLERHEGTLTTDARNKRYNRKMELALREMEWSSVLAGMLAGADYPAGAAGGDLAGDAPLSVPRHPARLVHQAGVRRERGALRGDAGRGGGVHRRERSARSLRRWTRAGMKRPVVVFNSLSWERTEWVNVDAAWVSVSCARDGLRRRWTARARVPETWPVMSQATPTSIENDVLRVPVRRGRRDRLDLRQTPRVAKCSSRAQPPTGWPSTPTRATRGTSRWTTPRRPHAPWNWSQSRRGWTARGRSWRRPTGWATPS